VQGGKETANRGGLKHRDWRTKKKKKQEKGGKSGGKGESLTGSISLLVSREVGGWSDSFVVVD